jgi:2-polyprenyl-6-methoxyphenol hydroxylase-like FAD-dependent oxidoreductase
VCKALADPDLEADDGVVNDNAQVIVVGGGPAGIVLGLLLARAGVRVTVLEKHADFLRDFRGDTVHPSTLTLIDELGLRERFDKLPQHRVQNLGVRLGNEIQPLADFHGLAPYDYMALVPQWDLLDLLVEAARAYPTFELRMRTEATGLIERDGRIVGVRARAPEGERTLEANLVVGADGRSSILRAAAGLSPVELGAPMDVLWFRLPRHADDTEDTFGAAGPGRIMVLINRGDYWQLAYLVKKGTDAAMRQGPIDVFREQVASLASFLADRVHEIKTWDDVKLLEVKVDRLPRWYRPGLLFIGDAAHAMSPIGGVGINLAVQDAVAAARILSEPLLRGGDIGEAPLRAVQRRRSWPTRIVQAIQIAAQNRIIETTLDGATPHIPALLHAILRLRAVRNLPARLVGYGIFREHLPPLPRGAHAS